MSEGNCYSRNVNCVKIQGTTHSENTKLVPVKSMSYTNTPSLMAVHYNYVQFHFINGKRKLAIYKITF